MIESPLSPLQYMDKDGQKELFSKFKRELQRLRSELSDLKNLMYGKEKEIEYLERHLVVIGSIAHDINKNEIKGN